MSAPRPQIMKASEYLAEKCKQMDARYEAQRANLMKIMKPGEERRAALNALRTRHNRAKKAIMPIYADAIEETRYDFTSDDISDMVDVINQYDP